MPGRPSAPAKRRTLRLPEALWKQIEFWRDRFRLDSDAELVAVALGQWCAMQADLHGLADLWRRFPESKELHAIRALIPAPSPAPLPSEKRQPRRGPRR